MGVVLTLFCMGSKPIFKNQYKELRAGWQIALFILLLAGASAACIAPAILLFEERDTQRLSVVTLMAVLLATYAATRFINRKPFSATGLALNRITMRQLGIGCLLGWLMMTAIFGVEYLFDYVKVVASEMSLPQMMQTVGLSLVLFAVAAMVEEVLFRGYLFQTLVRGVKFIPAVFIMGVLFGLSHLGNPNASAFGILNTVLVAAVFCLAYWRTRSLWLPFGIHFAWNFSQTTLYGYPTSGKHFSDYELTSFTQFGPEWLTGGAYGPEGGALATLLIVLCGVYLFFAESLKPAPGIAVLERDEEDLGTTFLERSPSA